MSNPFRVVEPKFSRSAIDRAGDQIRIGQYNSTTEEVVENFRASHNYILNTFQANIRGRIKRTEITFAQRLKRKATIYDKLKRESTIRLSKMHDIAGCRLIFKDENQLRAFRKIFHTSRFNHVMQEDPNKYDYISNPKQSGYRGVHDVYSYRAYANAGKRWNGLNIEIQYRTSIQHAWATAVEIAGSITTNQPKFNRGQEIYKEFFKLSSELLARAYEQRKSCCPDLSMLELTTRLNEIEGQIGILGAFEGLNLATEQFPNAKYVILIYYTLERRLKAFPFSNAAVALNKYFEFEKQSDLFQDIVLVRADKTETIRNAFRNYFSDAKEFLKLMRGAM